MLIKDIKSFISDTVLYTVFNLLNKAIPFLLLPFIVRMVSKEDFGIYSLFVSTEALLIPVITLNIHNALSAHYYDDSIKLDEYISTIFVSVLGFTLFFLLTSLCLPKSIASLTGLTKFSFFLSICTASVLALTGMISNFYRLKRNPTRYGVFMIAQSLLLLLSIITFCYIQPTSIYLIYGKLAFSLLFIIVCIVVLKREKLLLLTFNVFYFKKAFYFSLPTVLYSLSAFLFLSSDRFLINYFLGVESVGIYAGIFQLSSLISILGMSLNAAWMPWLFENLKKQTDDNNKLIIKLSYLLITLFFICGTLYCLVFKYVAQTVLPPSFHAYMYIAYPLIFCYVFEGIYLIVSPYLFYKEATRYNGLIGLVVAVFNISLNIVLIPKYGLVGTAYSTLSTWILLATLFFIFSNRVHPMPWLYFLNKEKNI